MRTLTVNFKIVISEPGEENLSYVIARTLESLTMAPSIQDGSFASGAQFGFEVRTQDFGVAEKVFKATVTATYENEDTE